MVQPPDLSELNTEIEDLDSKKEKAVSDQEFEAAAEFRDKAYQLRKKREEVQREWRAKQAEQEIVGTVDAEIIAETVSKMTGIPLTRLEKADEAERLLQMEKELSEIVIHQDDAIKAIARSVRRSRSGLKDPKRPTGSFIFLGPVRRGQDLPRQATREVPVRQEDALIMVDMSEYMEKHNVFAAGGGAPGLRRVRRGRPAHREEFAVDLTQWSFSTRSRRRTRTSSTWPKCNATSARSSSTAWTS